MPNFSEKFSFENVNNYLTYILLLLLIWGSVWALLGEEALPPRGYLFNLMVVFIIAYLSGELTKVVGLPPLLGMLVAGFVLGNVLDINLNKKLSAILRSIALVIILLRAGLELDPKAILRLSAVCVRLSFIPCIVESIVVAFVSHMLLNFPIVWGFLLGFVLAAVSPAVVVPGMISMQEKGLGVDKGVPTLVIAAASVDDVLAITGFGLCLGLAFENNSSLVWSILKGPVEALAGVSTGVIIGLILWFIPPKEDSNTKRLTLLLLTGLFSLFGSMELNMGGAGPLTCLVTPFVAALEWRKTEKINECLQQNLRTFWLIFQPFLFALIGTEVKLSALKGDAVGWALITLAIGLTIRTFTAIAVVFGAKLNWKERIFIGLAWLPKATVQAAVGPIALDLAREKNDPKSIELGNSVLTIAVLAILITAPIGAIAIALMGPKFLNRNSTKNENYFEVNEQQMQSIPNPSLVVNVAEPDLEL